MPEISRFFGVIVRMYFRDHAPPHLHAAELRDDWDLARAGNDLLNIDPLD